MAKKIKNKKQKAWIAAIDTADGAIIKQFDTKNAAAWYAATWMAMGHDAAIARNHNYKKVK